MLAPTTFNIKWNIQKNVVKKHRKRKKNRKRTRALLPWWFKRKLTNHYKKTNTITFKNRSLNIMVAKYLNKKIFKPMYKFVRNEDKFRSKPKVYDMKKFELGRVINGFRKRRFYHGRRYTEYNNAKPIYVYHLQETTFVPNKNVSRYIYTKYFNDNTLQFMRKKNKKKWIKKIVRPGIFFKQHFKSLKRTFRAKEKIKKYKFLTRVKSSTSWLIKSAKWRDFQSKFTLLKNTDKEKKAMRWTLYNAWRRRFVESINWGWDARWITSSTLSWKNDNERAGIIRFNSIFEHVTQKDKANKDKLAELEKEWEEQDEEPLEKDRIEREADEENPNLTKKQRIKRERIRNAKWKILRRKRAEETKDLYLEKEEQIIYDFIDLRKIEKVQTKIRVHNSNWFPIDFGAPKNLSNILFYQFYHEHYTSKERIVSIYNNNKHTFIRKNNYRVPQLFSFMHKRYRIKVGLKKIINFFKKLSVLKPYFTKDTEFFYSICFPNKLNYETQTNKINKYKIYLDQSVNFFFKKYYNKVLNNYSSKVYCTVEEHNLTKERCLEAYLSRTASRRWYQDKNFFKIHAIHKATLNKKRRKVLIRKKLETKKKLRSKGFRTFLADESFRQVRINTNWHDRIQKRGKHPISYFLWKHPLTKRFSKKHRIYKNRIKQFSINSGQWTNNDWRGLFHYFKRRIKKRRKKIITKVYFKYPRTSTVRDAKVNMSKGTITYAKKTRTYHGRHLKVKLRWRKTRYRRYLKNYIKRSVFFFNLYKLI